MQQKIFSRGSFLILMLVVSLFFAVLASTYLPLAYADEAAELEAQLKESASAYNDALDRQQRLETEIADLDTRILELETKLPFQRERSAESIKALYKFNYDTGSVLMMMLQSSSITDMLAIADSYTWILEYNEAEIRAAIEMQEELQNSRSQLEASKADADKAAQDALTSLEAAKSARERAAERAIAIQAADQEQVEAAINASMGSDEEKAAASSAAASSASSASASNVGWSSDKSAFVDEWASRIDSYLSGSPMAGTGKYYAAAAWDNGVDPRWAPAISYVESSMGAACYRSHNAWGYGGYSFSSWEEGIYRVVGSLGSSLYGGYLTRDAASTYCPSDPDHWYNTCAEQMAQI